MIENIRIIQHEQNEGFIAPCNDGAAQERGLFFRFLNNDMVVTKSWLSHLTRAAEPSPADLPPEIASG